MIMPPLIVISLLVILGALLVGVLLWFNTEHPVDGMAVEVFSPSSAPKLHPGQKIRVMTYNVQFFAGKNYVFFFDTPDLSGPDTRPTSEDISNTLDGIAQLIKQESPDIIVLQELDDGAKRTDYQNQLKLLLEKLPPEYCCYTSTFYWRLKFVPHPKIWGSSGMKLAIISRFQIASANRFHLPALPVGFLLKQLVGHRVLLRALFPLINGAEMAMMCTHLDAFTVGTDIMDKQLNKLEERLFELDSVGIPWVLGGDLNLLPPGQYSKIHSSHQGYYNPNTEMKRLYDHYQVIPSLEDVSGAHAAKWFTFWGNDPAIAYPDRTLDYIIASKQLKIREGHVRQENATRLSDHFPVVVTIEI